ncbi:hypothetical protein OEZ86_001627 [Tetradesmus obliquus]|nr:hypothetical protein OEZ86_001627 [Tetradesmus obliquus]
MPGVFEKEHYVRECSQLDTIFLSLHLAMSLVQRRTIIAKQQVYVFNIACVIFTATLLLKHFAKHWYHHWRTQIVFVLHIILTTLRALAVLPMASKQAVHWRVSLSGGQDSVAVLMATILSVLGGPFRAFEMLGLQQPFPLHVLNTVYYLLIHTAAAFEGCRLAYSNVMFYLVHEVHDGLAALVDTALDGLVGLPVTQQATCSSCAGPVLYLTLLLWGSVAMPLYVAYVAEQAARQRFCRRLAAADTGGAVQGRAGWAQQLQQQQQQQLVDEAVPLAAAGREMLPPPQQEMQQQQQQQQALNNGYITDGDLLVLADPGMESCSVSSIPNGIARWAVHLLLLLSMLLLCWSLANLFALQLLPKLLGSQQLDFWCPNKPHPPFVMAGQVYTGGDY